MRIWTLHPQYLDARGLVALWRETLLAQKVLAGRTRGYRNHPQLQRFRAHRQPEKAIAAYLWGVVDEAEARGYSFDASRIAMPRAGIRLPAATGQIRYEWQHLMRKLELRAPEVAQGNAAVKTPLAHPVFRVTKGPVADWERDGSLVAAAVSKRTP